MEQFDLLIIGSGPAGAAAAFKARSLGLGVCLVEKADIGGTCLNRGCIPTKVFLHGAKLLRDFREAERFGIDAGEPRFDFSRLSGWKDTVVQNLRKNQTAALLKAGVRMEAGEARIEEPGCVSIGAGKYAGARAILVAAGTAPARLPVQGNDLDGVYSSDDFLDGNGVFAKGDLFTGGPAPGVPKRLTIIGGGVIGVEFAAAYSAFGSELTVIEALPSLLASMDREIGQNLALLLKKRGVRIMTGVRISAIEKTGGVLRTLFSAPPDGSGGAETPVEADAILMAAGRKPSVSALFAPGLLPKLTETGFIAVDSGLSSSVPGIYAAGDISGGAFFGGLQLAHAAEAQGRYAAVRIAADLGKTPFPPPPPPCAIPACVYTSPEISSAGLCLAEAEKQGIGAIAGKGVFGSNGKAVLENMERGFVKLVFHAETRVIIGAQFFCNHATELVSWALNAIETRATAENIAETVFPHPSYGETIAQAARDAMDRGGLGRETQ